jgi:hypothetical protein
MWILLIRIVLIRINVSFVIGTTPWLPSQRRKSLLVQHLKVFHVHYGQPDSDMSQQLMKAMSLQIIDEDMGVPVSDICLEKALHPNESR